MTELIILAVLLWIGLGHYFWLGWLTSPRDTRPESIGEAVLGMLLFWTGSLGMLAYVRLEHWRADCFRRELERDLGIRGRT